MNQIHTDIQNINLGGIPHIQGHLVPPFIAPNVMLPHEQVRALVERIILVSQQQFPNRRSGVLRMGAGIQQAHRYSLSIRAPDLADFDYDQLFDNVETMVDSNDALEIGDITFLLALPNANG